MWGIGELGLLERIVVYKYNKTRGNIVIRLILI